jgi:hypothetical protein
MAFEENKAQGEECVSGMTVSYEVKDTFSEKGLGLFTREFIAKGQCVWRPVHALLAHGSDSGSGKKMAAGSNGRGLCRRRRMNTVDVCL